MTREGGKIMEDRPFVSVVMPVYGVEKYLKKAVDSVLEQTFQDFELILVDDCSPDKCPRICDELARSDERISVIHHEQNQGLSAARNSGLEKAQGQYIWFMDSDDYIENDLFVQAKESVNYNPAQVLVFGLTEDYYQDNKLHHSIEIKEKRQYLNREELRHHIICLEQKTLYGYAWNKFYQLDYLRSLDLQYEKVTLIEDILFNVKYFMDIDSMNVLEFSGYHYNKRMDNSLTSKYVPDYYELHRKRIQMIYEQYKYWNLCTSKIKEILAILYTRYIYSAIQRNFDVKARMNYKMRKIWVEKMLDDPLVKDIIPYGRSEDKLLRVMLLGLQKRNTMIILGIGRIIFVCKSKLPMFFAMLKQKRK